MLSRRQAFRGLGGLALLSVTAGSAHAAQLEFTPIIIEAPLGPFATTLEVANHGGGSSVLQVRAFAWRQTPDGADNMDRSDAIVVSPPMFTLPENETQIIRVVLHTAPGAVEQAFRILVDEIPPAGASVVQLALRVSLPVFACPAGAQPDLRWRVAQGDRGNLIVTARNTGQKHARISKLAVASPPRAPVAGQLVNRLPYVLAGSERSWRVPLGGLKPGSEVRLTADTDTKPVALSLPIET